MLTRMNYHDPCLYKSARRATTLWETSTRGNNADYFYKLIT